MDKRTEQAFIRRSIKPLRNTHSTRKNLRMARSAITVMETAEITEPLAESLLLSRIKTGLCHILQNGSGITAMTARMKMIMQWKMYCIIMPEGRASPDGKRRKQEIQSAVF